MDYSELVKAHIKGVKDQKHKDEVLNLYLYLFNVFPYELALADRDYLLGLKDDNHRHNILVKAYKKENQLRRILGLDPLPPVDLSIL